MLIPAIKRHTIYLSPDFHLDICPTGVTLWDTVTGRWIVDASCVVDDKDFVINRHCKRIKTKTDSLNPKFRAKSTRERKYDVDNTK